MGAATYVPLMVLTILIIMTNLDNNTIHCHEIGRSQLASQNEINNRQRTLTQLEDEGGGRRGPGGRNDDDSDEYMQLSRHPLDLESSVLALEQYVKYLTQRVSNLFIIFLYFNGLTSFFKILSPPPYFALSLIALILILVARSCSCSHIKPYERGLKPTLHVKPGAVLT